MPKRANYLMVDEADPQWVRFWNAYPKRVSKKDARKAWMHIDGGVTPALVDKMIEALAWQSQQPQWVKDGGQYAPFPATWINGEKWEDEAPAHLRPRERRCQYDHSPACDSSSECVQKFLAEQREIRHLRAV